MKFKTLTNSELEELQEEFIQYLVANGIDAEMWSGIQKDKPEEMSVWVDGFSDSVWDKILTNAKFVDQFSENEIKLFKLNEEFMTAVFIRSEKVNFLDEKERSEAFKDVSSFEVYKGKKKFQEDRNLEVFGLSLIHI